MPPEQLFSIRNTLISLALLVVCASVIRLGIYNENRIKAVRDDFSIWQSRMNRKDFTTEFSLHRQLIDAESRKSLEEAALIRAQIAEVSARRVDVGTVECLGRITDCQTKVHESFMKHIGNLSRVPFSTPSARIVPWCGFALSGLFLLLSTLRYTLQPRRIG